MSSASRPATDFGKESIENSTVPELISLLRSAFQSTDFHKVEKILVTREENMKTEIANWRKESELMEKKHGELALTKLEIEDELKKYKRECDVLGEQITRFKEDQRVYCGREKRTDESYAKLLADFSKAETENRKLKLKNLDSDLARCKAERKLESCKKTFEELNLRVLRLEEEVTMLMNGGPTCKEKKENEVGAEHPLADEMVGAKKTSNTEKSENEVGVGTGSGNLAQPQVKECVSNFYEKDHSLAGAGSASDSLEVESNHMREHRLLVYEFMPRGSLDNHLFRRSSYFQPLSWNIRMKVALGAAKGLAYLHSPEAKVIYRDFKTSNILLDSNYNAKLSDFGLAKDGPADGKSHVSTRVMGTFGYAAPEYMATGHLTAKSDIYSFGVVLLEMLTGRRAVDKNRPPGEHNLVEWAKPQLTNKSRILRVMDARIEGQYSLGGALRAATLAIKCLAIKPKFRPTMDEVVKALEQLQDLKDIESTGRETLQNHHSNSSSDPNCHRKCADEACNREAAASQKPSASPIHA